MLFAKFVLHETLNRNILIATIIICAGLVLAILFSSHATDSYTADDLIALYE